MTAKTANFGIEYLAVGEPVYTTRAVLQRNAETIEAALTRGGISPDVVQTGIAGGWFTDTGQVNITSATGLAAAFTVGSQGARYRKVGRWVYVMLHLTSTGGYAANAVPFVLPTGFRPGSRHYFTSNIGGTGSINTAGSIAFDTAGAANAVITMSTSFPLA